MLPTVRRAEQPTGPRPRVVPRVPDRRRERHDRVPEPQRDGPVSRLLRIDPEGHGRPPYPTEASNDYRVDSDCDSRERDEPLRDQQGDRHRSGSPVPFPQGGVEHVFGDGRQGPRRPRLGGRDPAEAQHEKGWLTMATVYKPPGRKRYIIEYIDENG